MGKWRPDVPILIMTDGEIDGGERNEQAERGPVAAGEGAGRGGDPEGTHPTAIPGVEVTRQSHPSPRTPVVYQPNIVVVGQGRKLGYLGDEVFTYDPFNYLVLSVPIPFDCETV